MVLYICIVFYVFICLYMICIHMYISLFIYVVRCFIIYVIIYTNVYNIYKKKEIYWKMMKNRREIYINI